MYVLPDILMKSMGKTHVDLTGKPYKHFFHLIFFPFSLPFFTFWQILRIIHQNKYCENKLCQGYGNTGCGVFKWGYKIRKVFA
jgi:hypothetical protein